MLLDKNLAKDVIDYSLLKGADFAELFVERDDRSQLVILNSKVHQVTGGIDFGLGLRLLFGTKVLYGYTNSLKRDVLFELVDKLCVGNIADENPKTLDFQQAQVASTFALGKKVPTDSWQEQKDFLMEVDKKARSKDQRLTQMKLQCLQRYQEVEIFNSENLHVFEARPYTRLVAMAMASEGGEQSTGQQAPGVFGYWDTLAQQNPAHELADQVVEEAMVSLNAKACPAGKMPVVLADGFGGVIFHEACGHLLETTSVQKKASVFHDKMDQEIASSVVNAVDDGTIDGAWGSVSFDDEGAKTQKTQLIKDGKLTSFLVDKVGALKTGYKPTGSGRRQSYRFAPASRMRNTFIEPGKDKFEDMIGSIEKGLYCKSLGGGSVQPGTGEFNFAATECYLIEKGKISHPVKGATLIGTGPEILKQISMVGIKEKLSAGTCGSVSGSVPVTVGQPPLKIDSILVGGSAS